MSLNVSFIDHEHHHRIHHKQEETSFAQTNLVSDGFVPATTIDPNLSTPGIAHSATSPFWVSDNGMGVTTVYTGAGAKVNVGGLDSIAIAAPPGQTTPASPTGDVFNIAGSGFNITSDGHTGSSVFIFATEDGTISGWNPNVDAASSVLAVDNSQGGTGAVYKGLAIAQTGHGTFLYAANFRNGTVDVFNDDFKQVKSFTDPKVPAGFAPFNVQVLDGHLFVTFALQDDAKHDDVAGAGNGFVDEFDLNGHLLHRVASGGVLDSPWDLRLRPPASANSPTTFSSGISATEPSMSSIRRTIISLASWKTPAAPRSPSGISGHLFPALAMLAAIRTRSTLRQACRTRRMVSLAACRQFQNRIIRPCR